MLQKLLNNKLRLLSAIAVVLLLAMVRAYEDVLFYDPLLRYFKTDFTGFALPDYNAVSLYGNLLLRFAVNSVLSLLLIYVIYKNVELVKVAAILYLVFGVILTLAFIVVIEYFPESKMTIFYIRRFLIQPILLLLFIPAFYFQQLNMKKQA